MARRAVVAAAVGAAVVADAAVVAAAGAVAAVVAAASAVAAVVAAAVGAVAVGAVAVGAVAPTAVAAAADPAAADAVPSALETEDGTMPADAVHTGPATSATSAMRLASSTAQVLDRKPTMAPKGLRLRRS